MQTVDVPAFTGRTNRDLAEWAIRLREALMQANANLQAVKEWADGTAE